MSTTPTMRLTNQGGATSVVARRPVQPSAVGDDGVARRVIRNSVYNLAAQGLYGACHVVVIATLARALRPATFGDYFTILSLVLVVQTLLEAGISSVVTRRAARRLESWRETAAEAGGLYAVVAPLSAAVFLPLGFAAAWWRGDGSLVPALAAAGVACGALQVQRFCAGVLGAFEQFHYENGARLAQGLLLAALLLVCRGDGRLEVAVALFAVSQLGAALIMLAGLWRLGFHFRPCWRRGQARDWLSESLPLGFGDFVRGATWQADTLLLGALQPAAAVGLFSIAYRPLGPINWIPLAVLTALFPALSRSAGQGRGLGSAFAASTRLLWVVSLPIAFGLSVGAAPVIEFIAGKDYLAAAPALSLLAWVTCLTFLSYPFRFVFLALGQSRAYGVLVVLLFVLRVGIGIALIQHWGVWGACAACCLSELLFWGAGLVLCRRIGVGGVEWRELGAAALVAAAVASLLLAAEPESVFALLLAGVPAAVVYLSLCVALGAVRPSELRRAYDALLGGFGKGRAAAPPLELHLCSSENDS